MDQAYTKRYDHFYTSSKTIKRPSSKSNPLLPLLSDNDRFGEQEHGVSTPNQFEQRQEHAKGCQQPVK